MTDERDSKIVFAAGAVKDGSISLLIGIPNGAVEMMRTGKSQDVDLRRTGIPLVVSLFTGNTHSDCVRQIQNAASLAGAALDDRRRDKFDVESNARPPIEVIAEVLRKRGIEGELVAAEIMQAIQDEGRKA